MHVHRYAETPLRDFRIFLQCCPVHLTAVCLLKAYDLRECRLEFLVGCPHDQSSVRQQD